MCQTRASKQSRRVTEGGQKAEKGGGGVVAEALQDGVWSWKHGAAGG